MTYLPKVPLRPRIRNSSILCGEKAILNLRSPDPPLQASRVTCKMKQQGIQRHSDSPLQSCGSEYLLDPAPVSQFLTIRVVTLLGWQNLQLDRHLPRYQRMPE